MKLYILSLLTGPTKGYHTFDIDEKCCVEELVSNFCLQKNILHDPNYVLLSEDHKYLPRGLVFQDEGFKEGAVLFLSYKSFHSGKLYGFSKWWILCGIGFILGGASIFCLTILYLYPGSFKDSVAIIINFDDELTSISQFKWRGEKIFNTGILEEQKHSSCSRNIFLNNSQSSVEYLDQCLTDCLTNFSSSMSVLSKTESYILGYGSGVFHLSRLLNPTFHEAVSYAANNAIKHSGFHLLTNPIKSASENMDGLYNWIAWNDIAGNLIGLKNTEGIISYDSFDLKIAGEVPHIKTSADYSNSTSVILYGRPFTVQISTSLCYGSELIHLRYLAYLILTFGSVGSSLSIRDPCGPTSSIDKYSVHYLTHHPCTITKTPQPIDQNETVKFYGYGDYISCIQSVKKLLNGTQCQSIYKNPFCLPSVTFEGPMTFKILPTVWLKNFLNTRVLDTEDKFMSLVKDICSLSWEQLMKLYSGSFTEHQLQQLCFQLNYLYSLIKYGSGEGKLPWNKLDLHTQFSTSSSYGYLLNLTTTIKSPKSPPYINLMPWLFVVVNSSILVLMTTCLLVHVIKISDKSYQQTLTSHLKSKVYSLVKGSPNEDACSEETNET